MYNPYNLIAEQGSVESLNGKQFDLFSSNTHLVSLIAEKQCLESKY